MGDGSARYEYIYKTRGLRGTRGARVMASATCCAGKWFASRFVDDAALRRTVELAKGKLLIVVTSD